MSKKIAVLAVLLGLPSIELLARVPPGPLAATPLVVPARPGIEADPSSPPTQVIDFEPLVITARLPRTRSEEPWPKPTGSDRLVGTANINTAPAELLRLLPGLGPKRAQALIAYRARRPFSATRQVQRIRGIGPKTYRRWKPHLSVEGDNTLTAPRSR